MPARSRKCPPAQENTRSVAVNVPAIGLYQQSAPLSHAPHSLIYEFGLERHGSPLETGLKLRIVVRFCQLVAVEGVGDRALVTPREAVETYPRHLRRDLGQPPLVLHS